MGTELIKKARKKLRKKIAPLIFLGAALFGSSTLANTGGLEKKTFSPRISIISKDPGTNAESNTELANSAYSLLGETTQYLNKSDSWQSRALEAFTDGIGDVEIGVTSHEYGHYRVAEKNNGNPKVHIKFPLGSYCKYGNEKFENGFKATLAGPNQDSLNAQALSENFHLDNSTQYNLHLAKLVTRMRQTLYLNLSDSSTFNNFFEEGVQADYKKIADYLNENGYDVSLRQFQRNNLAINLLNPGNYESAWNVWKFLAYGKRQSKPLYFNLTKNLKAELPDLAHYFTLNGEYAELSEFLKYRDQLFEMKIGSDLDFTQNKAGVNTLKFGGKICDVPINDRLSFSPYAYGDFQRNNLKPKGYNAGTELKLKLAKGFYLTGKAEYNEDDLMAEIKGKENGFYGFAGVKINF
jgi:hypothetical protein